MLVKTDVLGGPQWGYLVASLGLVQPGRQNDGVTFVPEKNRQLFSHRSLQSYKK